MSDSSGDQVSLLDTIQDPAALDPATEMDTTEMKDRRGAIARLPEREKLVVALYYYENLTLREIGEVLGVTESRVSQLHKGCPAAQISSPRRALGRRGLTSRPGASAPVPRRSPPRRAADPCPVAGCGSRSGPEALRGLALEELLEAAARAARAELDTDYASLVELTGDGQGLLVRAGAGLPDGVMEACCRSAPTSCRLRPRVRPAGGGRGLRHRDRAGLPEQRDLGVVSAMAAPIGGRGRHYGVFAVHNRTARWFSPYDLHFLHALANVVSLAVGALATRSSCATARRASASSPTPRPP